LDVNLISTIFPTCVVSFAFGHMSSLRYQIRGLSFGAGQCKIRFGAQSAYSKELLHSV
jgi:hypothetical protein